MPQLKLHIKNMVCHRCKIVVTDVLEKLHLHPVQVSLGEVTLSDENLSAEKLHQLSAALNAVGFALLDDRKGKMIEQIKAFIIETIRNSGEKPKRNYSEMISRHLHHDYSALSNLFSQVEGITIEQYIINQKIEKAKELLTYNESSLSEIAIELGYSSTAHLSNQFKRATGLTPSAFRRSGRDSRLSLDEVGKPE